MINKEGVFKIGYFTKPHGIKGEIGLVTDYELFDGVDDPFLVCEIEGVMVPFFIESSRTKSQTVQLVKFAAIDSEEAVREFAGKDVYYPLAAGEQPKAPVDASWDSFAGYTLVDEKYGVLGEITGIDESTMNVLLQVDYKGDELLIPAVGEWITVVERREKRLRVSIPEGLLDM